MWVAPRASSYIRQLTDSGRPGPWSTAGSARPSPHTPGTLMISCPSEGLAKQLIGGPPERINAEPAAMQRRFKDVVCAGCPPADRHGQLPSSD